MKIREMRKLANLSQLRLAQLAQVSRYKLYLVENGFSHFSREEISRITMALKKAGIA